MSRPLIFMSTHRVAAGRGDDLRALATEYVEFVRAHEPATVGLHLALDEDGTELTYVQIQPDPEAMDEHLSLVIERFGTALEIAPPTSIKVCGTPGPVLRGALDNNRDAGVPITVVRDRLDGFVRAPQVQP